MHKGKAPAKFTGHKTVATPGGEAKGPLFHAVRTGGFSSIGMTDSAKKNSKVSAAPARRPTKRRK